MALHTDEATRRAGFTRRVETPPTCPDCDRVLHAIDAVRSGCRVCGQVVVIERRLLRHLGEPDPVPVVADPDPVDFATVDIKRRSHVVRPGPGQEAFAL